MKRLTKKMKKLTEGRKDQEEPGISRISEQSPPDENSKTTTTIKQQIITTDKTLQLNVGRSKAAHDLLEATATKDGKTITLLSKSNVNITKQNDKWKTDIKIDVAIKIRDNNIACVRQGRGKGFVYVEVKDISPNYPMEEYDTFLSELQSSILSKKKEGIIGGGFDVNSSDWGSRYPDIIGKMLAEMMATVSATAGT
ncbi:hypothetical protein HHI36_003310 [Cryptolaemus montrouzieri]|uniref:Uncharacterized protein n=1 Tax=Cryptolaemus montrouzieri TaxID=559131 RepID=A0ABD2PDJ9_9CUCU